MRKMLIKLNFRFPFIVITELLGELFHLALPFPSSYNFTKVSCVYKCSFKDFIILICKFHYLAQNCILSCFFYFLNCSSHTWLTSCAYCDNPLKLEVIFNLLSLN